MNGLSKSLGFLCLVTSVLLLTFCQNGEAVVPHQPGCPKGWGKCSGYKHIFLNREKKVTKIITFIQRASACLSMDVTLFQFFCDKKRKKMVMYFVVTAEAE